MVIVLSRYYIFRQSMDMKTEKKRCVTNVFRTKVIAVSQCTYPTFEPCLPFGVWLVLLHKRFDVN